MKSAYDLAMERLQAQAPAVEVTEGQRQELAEVDRKFKAKIAERELFLQGLITKAQTEANLSELAALQSQLHRERERLQSEMEAAKEAIRSKPQQAD